VIVGRSPLKTIRRVALFAPAALLLVVPLTSCKAQGTAEAQEASDIPQGPVADRADIIPQVAEQALDAKLRGYFERSGTAIIVATLPTLGGEPIDKVAFETFNRWGIGDAKTNRGLLVLVAPNERKMRIEVGCGLEKPITSDFAKQVIEQQMVPQFRSGDYVTGIESGVHSLVQKLDTATEFGPTSEVCLKIMKRAA